MSIDHWTCEVGDEDETARLADSLAACLPPRAMVTLDGPLGAGKTRFVRALAAADGVDPRDVSSPTFTLVHEYHGRVPIYHFDAYRVGSDREFLDLGFDEYLAAEGWTLVEWGAQVERALPAERLEIRFEVVGETRRRVTLVAHGAAYAIVLGRLSVSHPSSGTSRGSS